jgi:SAM-dependent methyltransferase
MSTGTPTPVLDPTFDSVESVLDAAPRRRRRATTESARKARVGSINYAVRAPLLRWLEAEGKLAATQREGYRALDVGCGTKPYQQFFAEAEVFVGVDPSGRADLVGSAENIPVGDGTFDVVLCNQVLEHTLDPAKVVQELRRVVAPGGRILLSTHGVQVYHPAPLDLWRWTHAGLEQLFRSNGEWSSVTVTPASGPASCIAMLMAIYVDLLLKRLHVRFLARPIIAVLNWSGKLLDRLVGTNLRPGEIHANYHVVAEV